MKRVDGPTAAPAESSKQRDNENITDHSERRVAQHRVRRIIHRTHRQVAQVFEAELVVCARHDTTKKAVNKLKSES
jgi:hypothetical protein